MRLPTWPGQCPLRACAEPVKSAGESGWCPWWCHRVVSGAALLNVAAFVPVLILPDCARRPVPVAKAGALPAAAVLEPG